MKHYFFHENMLFRFDAEKSELVILEAVKSVRVVGNENTVQVGDFKADDRGERLNDGTVVRKEGLRLSQGRRCGKCGKVGHNARRCAKTPT